jgi:polyisoprenoid-binding protein YceI
LRLDRQVYTVRQAKQFGFPKQIVEEDDMSISVRMTEPRLRARLADGSLAGLWRLDPARTTVGLHTKSMWGLAPVKGVFGVVSGEGVLSGDGKVTGRITVDAASLDTRNKKRDVHLRSEDFLHSDAHPHIVFTVDGVTPAGDQATVAGTLQIRGRTRRLTFPATVTASDDEVRLDAEVRIDRSDFGLTWNQLGMASMQNTITVGAVFVRH